MRGKLSTIFCLLTILFVIFIVSPCAYSDDHGNDCTSATPVSSTSTTSGDIETTGDWDFFRIDLTGYGVLTIYSTGYEDFYGYLYGSGCTVITQDDDSGSGGNFRMVESLSAGTYYVAVKHTGYLGTTGPYTLHVEFVAQVTHIITASAGTGGTISPSGTVTVSEGASKTFSIIPDGDNSVADVLVDGISVGTPYSWNFNNVTANHYIEAVFNLSAECTDLSSVPLSAVKKAAPPNIMFVLDDSGSMDWEFLTEEDDGKFQNYEYVFNNPGDNVYGNTNVISKADRKKWKSQWSGYNKLFYDPSVTYDPWPTLSNADPDTPRSHPVNSTPTFSLNDTYYLFGYDYNAIVVDDQDGPPSYVETGTGWGESAFEPEYNGHSQSTVPVGSACFTPDLPAAGTYDVYAWWNCCSTRDQNAKITITCATGPEVIYRNQRATVDHVPECPDPSDPFSPCCGQWTLLGSYPFGAGTAGSVTIERHAGSDQTSTVADAVKFVPTLDIKNAHYYTFDDANANGMYDAGETVYLVVIEDSGGVYTIRYYRATVSGPTEEVTDLIEVTAPNIPASVQSTRTPEEERQNFANWYSFYRRRGFTAAAAVANTIVSMEGVRIGFYSINHALRQPVLSVKAIGEDHTAELLDGLYNLAFVGGT